MASAKLANQCCRMHAYIISDVARTRTAPLVHVVCLLFSALVDLDLQGSYSLGVPETVGLIQVGRGASRLAADAESKGLVLCRKSTSLMHFTVSGARADNLYTDFAEASAGLYGVSRVLGA